MASREIDLYSIFVTSEGVLGRVVSASGPSIVIYIMFWEPPGTATRLSGGRDPSGTPRRPNTAPHPSRNRKFRRVGRFFFSRKVRSLD
jgi:hypothetical protein